MTLNDLTQFVLEATNLDTYCLFLIYLPSQALSDVESPSNESDAKKIKWLPYYENYPNTNYSGYYDPYYQQLFSKDEKYDPTFKIDDAIFDLNEIEEYKEYNFNMVP